MMDDPRWIFDYASQIVAPVTGNIISQIAPYLGIERDASYDSNGSVEVPNAIGTRWTSAQVKMNAAGLSHRFVDTSDGDVVYQYPAGGTVVPAGSTVYLYTQSTTDATTTVPDATGKTGTFAAQMLKASGVNVAISGSASDRVVSQDVEVGSVVPYGTVVTLTTEPDAAAMPSRMQIPRRTMPPRTIRPRTPPVKTIRIARPRMIPAAMPSSNNPGHGRGTPQQTETCRN